MRKKLNIVTLGGGSGAPAVLKALTKLSLPINITAICAATDSGGKTGAIRSDERDRVIAVSDLLRNLLALLPENGEAQLQAFTEMLSFTDGRNRNLGYTIYYALLEKYHNDFKEVQKHFERLLEIKFLGQAIPVTLEPTNIVFKTISGNVFTGEHELDRLSMSADLVTDFWLDQPCQITHEAKGAIEEADYLIFCPGSLYGSVLANLLPQGMTKVINSSNAQKILITNLVSDRNQTHDFTIHRYWQVFGRYANSKKPFDLVITSNLSSAAFSRHYPQVAANYKLEHSKFLGTKPHDQRLTSLGVSIIKDDIFNITKSLGRIRHDPDKLAKVFTNIFTQKTTKPRT